MKTFEYFELPLTIGNLELKMDGGFPIIVKNAIFSFSVSQIP